MDLRDYRVSDDQVSHRLISLSIEVMHLHTAEALSRKHGSMDDLYDDIAREYIRSFGDMTNRSRNPSIQQGLIHKLETLLQHPSHNFEEDSIGEVSHRISIRSFVRTLPLH